MSRCKKAPAGAHSFIPARRGSREKCAWCGTRFPCGSACDHVDCRIERGDPMPPGVTLIEAGP